MGNKWVSLLGQYETLVNGIAFKGGSVIDDGKTYINIGNFLYDAAFSSGEISCDVIFSDIKENTGCEIIIFYDSQYGHFVTAGISNDKTIMFTIRHFDATEGKSKWTYHGYAGDKKNLKPNQKYSLKVKLQGSRVSLSVDNIEVLTRDIPFNLPQSSPGIWCSGLCDINITNFNVISERPKAFVIMQYTSPYNELYSSVIKKVCDDFGIEAIRADETYTPGIIISDVSKQIINSKFIIAEISPTNSNVFYEVGYAHALNKPTILLADRNSKLPFDVSPFRTLFYENSIAGKEKIEEGLRKYLSSIMKEVNISSPPLP